MKNFLLTVGQKEWLLLLVISLGLTYILQILFVKDKQLRRKSGDSLQNSVLLSYALNRLIFLVTHFDTVLRTPLSLFQGKNGLISLVITLLSMPLFYILFWKKRRLSLTPLCIFPAVLALSMGVFFAVGSPDSSGSVGVYRGDKVPPAVLAEDLNLEDLSEELVILNFWATWCPPCRAEMPELDRFISDYGEEIRFYGVNLTATEKSPRAAEVYLKTNTFDIPLIMDPDGELSALFKIEKIPTTLVIGPGGIVLDRKEETVSYDYLKSFLIK